MDIFGFETPDIFVAEFTEKCFRQPGTAENLMFNGICYPTGRLPLIQIGSSEKLDVPVNNCEATGEFVTVDRTGDREIEVSTDSFGYYKLFYTSHELNGANLNAISNDFGAMVAFLKNRGCGTKINSVFASTVLAAQSKFFNYAHDNDTCSALIRRVGADEFLHFSNKLTPRKRGNFWKLTEKNTYNDLITAGIERSHEAISNAIKYTGQETVQVYMSGGRDSRAVLAILLDALSPNQIRCITHDPQTQPQDKLVRYQDDFRISAGLVEEFGLDWGSVPKSVALHMDAEDLVRKWSFSGSNTSFRIRANQQRPLTDGICGIEIRGGGGETLRGFWGSMARRFGLGDDLQSKAENFFASTVNTKLMSEDVRASARDAFVSNIRSLPGTGFTEKLESHYTAHRNRYHFGNSRHAMYERGQLILFPLATPEFRWAAQMVPYGQRRHGVAAFDISESILPRLNDIELEHKPWSRIIQSMRRKVAGTRMPAFRQDHPYLVETGALPSVDRSVSGPGPREINRAMKRLHRDNLEILRDSIGDTICAHSLKQSRAGIASLRAEVAKSESAANAAKGDHLRFSLYQF